MCLKSGPETIYFRSNIYKSLASYFCMIKFNFDMSLQNCAHYGTLEGGLFRPRIYGNPAQYVNRPNCSGQ